MRCLRKPWVHRVCAAARRAAREDGWALAALLALGMIAFDARADQVQARAARTISADAGIEAVCCGAFATAFEPDAQAAIRAFNAAGPLWLRIDTPLAGRFLLLGAVVDRAVLHWREQNTGHWRESLTGDHVRPADRSLATPSMVLPVPASADSGPYFLRIDQPSWLYLRLEEVEAADFEPRQSAQHALKLILFGFISAIVAYNLVVSVVLRDPVFMLNAVTILAMLAITAYLTGYGAYYLWPEWPHAGDRIMNAALAVANVGGPLFIREYLRRAGPDRRAPVSLLLPVALAPIVLALGSVAEYQHARHALLVVSALTMAILTGALLAGALRGDRHARLIGMPFVLAMVPGVSIAALHRVAGMDPGPLSDNALGVFLAMEAMLFSLVLASRVRAAEIAHRRAIHALLDARRGAGERILRAQDAERRRVAQDLHDEVGQRLLWLINTLRVAAGARSDPRQARGALERAASDAAEVLEGMRRISRAMHPAMLDHLGWRGAVAALADGIRRDTGIDCVVEDSLDGDLPSGEAGLHLYRIVQESLGNVVRHAHAEHCVVRIDRHAGGVRLRIDDDGIGPVDPGDGRRRIGLGLTSIDERVQILGGAWRIGPSPLGGTRIEVDLSAPGAGTALSARQATSFEFSHDPKTSDL